MALTFVACVAGVKGERKGEVKHTKKKDPHSIKHSFASIPTLPPRPSPLPPSLSLPSACQPVLAHTRSTPGTQVKMVVFLLELSYIRHFLLSSMHNEALCPTRGTYECCAA